MPAGKSTRPMYGVTGFGKQIGVPIPSILYLADTVGNHWALWFDTAGVLRTASAPDIEVPGTDFNLAGTPHAVVPVVEDKKADPKAKKSA